jgi:hypothetical protein
MKPLGSIVPGALAALLRSAPISPAQIEFAWRVAVGPAIGRATSVRLEGTTLLVEAESPEWTREVSRSSSLVLARLQTLVGAERIATIRVRQGHG